MQPYTAADFDHSPLLVFYETTRACNLKCVHCRADAQTKRHPEELNTEQSKALIKQLNDFQRPPLLVLTGGDPFKRKDLFELISYARGLGLMVALSPSATPLVTDEAIANLQKAGLHRVALSLDAADPETHDNFRRVPGSFQRTLHIIAQCRKEGIPVQVNTTIAKHNIDHIDAMAAMLEGMDIELWSVFFLIPTGRGLAEQRITPLQYEMVFEKLYNQMKKSKYAIKTTEAPQYRRFLAIKMGGAPNLPARLVGTNDGRGVMFVSHVGEIFPSGFMPIECGRYPTNSLVDTYVNAPMFKQLRNSDLLHGKCGVCDYRFICGGSRARSYALTGDPLAAEPDCGFQPPKWTGGPGPMTVSLTIAGAH